MSRNIAFDVEFARSFFPALDPSWSYFENAGGTFPPVPVVERAAAYMRECQVYHGEDFAHARDAHARILDGKAVLAALIGAEPEEVVVGPSTTANVYVLSHAIRPWWKDGDEIVVTQQDHEANSGAWRRLAETGITVREWKIDPATGELDPAGLDALLGPRTRLVCFPAASNIVGTVNDAAGIVARVHAAGALACVDGVAYTPHRAVDVKAMDADFYLYSAYKVFGPHVSVMYGKAEHLARAKNQNHYFVEGDPGMMFAPGGPNHELTAASAGIRDYFEALHDHHFETDGGGDFRGKLARVNALAAEHEARLAARLAGYLAGRPDVRLIGHQGGEAERRVAVLSFLADGRDSSDLAARLQARGASVRAGDFYAARCIDALGARPQNGVVRASMVHYTSMDDVERLIDGLDAEL